MTKGCLHVHVKDGEITNIFCHLSDLPMNGVVHLKPNQMYTKDEFIAGHPDDENELIVKGAGRIYNLGANSI